MPAAFGIENELGSPPVPKPSGVARSHDRNPELDSGQQRLSLIAHRALVTSFCVAAINENGISMARPLRSSSSKRNHGSGVIE